MQTRRDLLLNVALWIGLGVIYSLILVVQRAHGRFPDTPGTWACFLIIGMNVFSPVAMLMNGKYADVERDN